MSAVLYSASGNNACLQGTAVGGSKPLHRFIKGQPKIIGIIVMIMGSGILTLSITVGGPIGHHSWAVIPPGVLMGLLFVICGILYILTEHKTTKKTVTISLALSIVTILMACWTILYILPDVIHHQYRYYEYSDENTTDNEETIWQSYNEAMVISLEVIFLVHSFAGAIIFIVMSIMAGAALRSSKSQTIVVMASKPEETQDNQQAQEEDLNCEKMDD